MIATTTEQPAPAGKQAQSIRAVLAAHAGAGRDALIPILQEVQEVLGFLSREAVEEISRHLRLPASKIYGVATFYNQFRFQPKGKHHFMVCRGTACHVKGSLKGLEMAVKQLKLKPGQTSHDQLFSLETVACMGACGLAPVVNVNGEFYAKVAPAKLARIIAECREKELTNANA
ncbi:MAG: NAD(P)H-dependent oxidoreductase subunit E [Planctomycetota bacterium]|nr:NAD(P)H-dependent oxidoreductase subunit E [Planctomycetota bacterium]